MLTVQHQARTLGTDVFDLRFTIFLYNSRASSSVVSAPTLLSMTSPYWLRHRYVDMAPFDLDGSRNSRVFVNSLFSAPGKRTLHTVSYEVHSKTLVPYFSALAVEATPRHCHAGALTVREALHGVESLWSRSRRAE